MYIHIFKGMNNSLLKCSKLNKSRAMKLVLRPSLVLKAGNESEKEAWVTGMYMCMYVGTYLYACVCI
jgi:hypothetical protein